MPAGKARIGGLLVQVPVGARMALGIQPGLETTDDLRVENLKHATINVGLARRSPRKWPEIGRGAIK